MASHTFVLPDLGEGLESAEISQWLVSEGDAVTLNQPLVEVNTEKALVEIPSPVAGAVVSLHGGAGDEVKVGAPLVTFEVAGRKAVLVGYGVDAEAKSRERIRLNRPEPGHGVSATPAIRKRARELGVDLSAVTGSGPGGRITRSDVESFGPAPVAVSGTRRIIAQRMTAAWTQVPHVTTYLTVDCTALEEFRGGLGVTALPVVVRALADVCAKHPLLNAFYQSDEIAIQDECHVGVATDTPNGLLVPVIRSVRSKAVTPIATEMGELVTAAREGRATRDQLTGSTITVSNVGSFGAEYGTPIINLPEVAILAVGVIEPRVLAVRGEPVVRPATVLSLSFDHRALDGAQAGLALADLREILEDPSALGSLN